MEETEDGKHCASLKGALAAEEKVGLKMNVPEGSLKRVMSLLSSLHSPTISQLSDTGWSPLRLSSMRRPSGTYSQN